MKKLPFVAAAALAFAVGARADDPPPAKPPAPATPPAAAGGKHENKVSDDAKALFEKMSKTVNGPLRKGAKEITGTLTVDGQQGPITLKFTVKAPGVVNVEAPKDAPGGGGGQGGGQGGRQGRGMGGMMGPRMAAQNAEQLLGYAFGVFRPAEESEFDAEIAKKDGKDVLVVTRFKDGAQIEKREATLDANGLVASSEITRTMAGRDGAKREFTTNVTYTWTKNADSYRLDKYEVKSERGSSSTDVKYADVGGMSIPTSWTSTMQGPQSTTIETKVGDLVVDGKKVETDAPKKADGDKPKKGEKKDKDDDDDDDKKDGMK